FFNSKKRYKFAKSLVLAIYAYSRFSISPNIPYVFLDSIIIILIKTLANVMDLQRTFEIFNDYGRPKVIKKDILQSVRKSCTLMNDLKIFIYIIPPKGYSPTTWYDV